MKTGEKGSTIFGEKLISNRYKNLNLDRILDLSRTQLYHEVKFLQQIPPEKSNFMKNRMCKIKLSSEEKNKLKENIDELVDKFEKIPLEIREIILADYVEEKISNIYGLKMTPLILSICLGSSMKE